jgi:prepilin-type N-terminal cleavage/methylation domain-containing protein
MRRRGLTLVEVLVALAIGSLVLSLAAATGHASRRLGATIDARAIAGQRATAVPQLIGGALGLAGRGLDGCGLHVADGGGRARLLGVDLGDAAPETVEIFAGLDGGGRPALYHRTLPHARQPWLEDVTGFRVLAGRAEDGTWRAIDHDAVTRWTALRVELAWTDGDARGYELRLPHAPCAEPLP